MRRVSLLWLAVVATVWWILASSGEAPGALGAPGAVAVLLGVLLHLGLGGRALPRPRLRGFVAFAVFFLGQVIRGGVDVSRRALSPSLPLDPDMVRYRISLPEGVARVIFINTISLLPGTFSARFSGDEVTVHRLAEDLGSDETLRELEARVGGIFGLEPGEGT